MGNYPFTEGRDAAYAQNIGSFGGVVGGYFGGPNAYHIWSPSDWTMFKNNRKLPIWVAGDDGEKEGAQAVAALNKLGVPRNRPIAVDMENRGGSDTAYLSAFQKQVQNFSPDDWGWMVFVYGSAASIMKATRLSGGWVADWTGEPHMYKLDNGTSHGIRGTQWASNLPPGYDVTMWFDDAVTSMWI